ncbi:MAG: protein arginine kinase [Synergistetes bacterium]|nr:MAG: ATP:guanido phosphotransferase [bacterium 42_11]MBC7331487.1 protein arginine kinase [Synergistota bacterium]MDK2871151.1 protein arginine kinase [bacterium]
MKVEDIKLEWLKGKGPNSNIAVSSRIRLARNLKAYPFPSVAKRSDLEGVVKEIRELLHKDPYFKPFSVLMLGELSQIEREALVEKHLISPDHANNGDKRYGALLVEEEGVLSMMINEEDHLRIQCFLGGLQLSEAWRIIDQFDSILEKYIDYAFDEEFGYLTSCPTNVGTGLRASVMLHLPALTIAKKIGRVIEELSKLGLTVRGLYGEGTGAIGNLYQISNQITLGPSEEEVVDKIEKIALRVIEEEELTRKHILKLKGLELEDSIWRAYGILKHARLISSKEAMELLSKVRMGVDMGILPAIDKNKLNELIIKIRPAHLQLSIGKELSPEERDKFRADLIRSSFTGGEK